MALRLAYEVVGQGPPRLLMLHGFTGSRRSWDHLRTELSNSTALVVDLPGHGDSPLPSHRGVAGFIETVDALAGLTEPFGALDVVGYSQGARVALGYAVRYPWQVRRLVLESGSAGLRHRRKRHERRARDEQLATYIERNGVDAFVRRWEMLPLFAGVRSLPESIRCSLRERRSAHSPEGLAGALRALGVGSQPDFWPRLPLLRIPTLLVSGRHDLKFTEIARRMCAELPWAWRCALDAHHAPHLETPRSYWDEVRAFLEAPMEEPPLFDQMELA